MHSTQIPLLQNGLCGLREAAGEISTWFKDSRNPIRESPEKMRQAFKHLQRVNDQTQAATSRVLDIAESIIEREVALLERLNLVKDEIGKGENSALQGHITSCLNLTEQNQHDTFAIIEALQFQDITAQQLARTMDLLREVEARMDVLSAMMDTEGATRHKLSQKEKKKDAILMPRLPWDKAGKPILIR